MASSLLSAPRAGFARSFSLVARLAEAVPVFRASMPDDLERAGSAARELVDRVAS